MDSAMGRNFIDLSGGKLYLAIGTLGQNDAALAVEAFDQALTDVYG
jgi:hypothetical protein